MPLQVCAGATLTCRFGTTQSVLQVVAPDRQVAPGKASATILDHQPLINIQPFGLCQSLINPAVALVTTATVSLETLKPAQAEKSKICSVCGQPVCSCLVSLTPQPCIPVTPTPWSPGSPTMLIGKAPALNDTSKLICTWAGVIEVVEAGQTTFQVP